MAYVFRNGLFFILINLISDIKADCVLSLSKDYGDPGPVFVRGGTYMQPDAENGAVTFRRSETVIAACPGSKLVLKGSGKNYNVREVNYYEGSSFWVDNRDNIMQFRDITCKKHPTFTSQKKAETCVGGNELHEVGYIISGAFYPVYTACFDRNLLRTRYVFHKLNPTSSYTQPLPPRSARPSFIGGSIFTKNLMERAYSPNNQETRVKAFLPGTGGKKKEVTLTRGHLAARADYTFSAQTRATFHYVNTAPQWNENNAGDWSTLEKALRSRIHLRGSEVHVYTGTHGVMKLPNLSGSEMYLDVDEYGNQRVPVPMYFYKVVYDPERKTATAFVSIHSPSNDFYDTATIKRLSFCTNICRNEEFSWLEWRKNDGTPNFCCDYHDFVNTVNDLPVLDVTGRFY